MNDGFKKMVDGIEDKMDNSELIVDREIDLSKDYSDGELVERKKRSAMVVYMKPWRWWPDVKINKDKPDSINLYVQTWDYHTVYISFQGDIKRIAQMFSDVSGKIIEALNENHRDV